MYTPGYEWVRIENRALIRLVFGLYHETRLKYKRYSKKSEDLKLERLMESIASRQIFFLLPCSYFIVSNHKHKGNEKSRK